MKTIQEEYKEWGLSLWNRAKGLGHRYGNAEVRQKVKDNVSSAAGVTWATTLSLTEKYANRDVRRSVGRSIVKALIVALTFERDLLNDTILPKLRALIGEEPAQPEVDVAVASENPVLLYE